jgi:hypothetical protein
MIEGRLSASVVTRALQNEAKKLNAIMAIWIPLRGTRHRVSGQHRSDYGMVF